MGGAMAPLAPPSATGLYTISHKYTLYLKIQPETLPQVSTGRRLTSYDSAKAEFTNEA